MRFYVMDHIVEEDGTNATIIGDEMNDDFGLYVETHYARWVLEALNAHDQWTRTIGSFANQLPHMADQPSRNEPLPAGPVKPIRLAAVNGKAVDKVEVKRDGPEPSPPAP